MPEVFWPLFCCVDDLLCCFSSLISGSFSKVQERELFSIRFLHKLSEAIGRKALPPNKDLGLSAH